MVICNECGKVFSFWKAFGPLFKPKINYCSKECLYKAKRWNLENDMCLDEFNELQIEKLTKRIEKLENKCVFSEDSE